MLTTLETQERGFPDAVGSRRAPVSEQPVFQIASETYTWKDVFIAARLDGEWQALQDRTARAVACQKKLQDSDEELDDEELDQACEAFRYEKDLIAAEELEAWLENAGLTVENWIEFIERRILLDRWSDELDEILDEHPVSDEEIMEALKIDGVCAGDFQRFAYQLAAQAALRAAENDAHINKEEIRDLLQSVPDEIRHYPGIERFAELKLVSDRYRCEQITEKKIHERIQSHLIDYVRFQLQMLTFEDESVASEAALCIREDGETFESLSKICGSALEESTLYSIELEREIRDSVTGALPGEFIGPIKTSKGEFVVVQVLAKHSPSSDDPDLQQRAQDSLFQSIRNYEVNNRVRWHRTNPVLESVQNYA